MEEKTTGIVLYVLPYNDKVSIAHVYTEAFGREAYLLPLSNTKRGRMLRPLFSPFSILELDIERKNNRELQRFKEVRQQIVLKHIHFDPVKNAIALFLAELLSKVISEPEPNRPMYKFLINSIQILDLLEEGKANFHLCFLIQLSGYLGFYPNVDSYREGSFFDLLNSEFVLSRPSHAYFLDPKEATQFFLLMRMNYENLHYFRFSREERMTILERCILYFRLHHAGFKDLKSTDVLKALFD